MAEAQAMTQAITEVIKEAAKAVVQAMAAAVVDTCTKSISEVMNMLPWLGRSSLSQSSFNWSGTDMHVELRNFINKGKQDFQNL